MHLYNAIAYPFQLKENKRILLYASLLLLIPILGLIIWTGYLLRVIREQMIGRTDRLPSFSFVEDFVQGLAVIFANIFYFLPVLVLAFVGGLIIGFVFGANQFLANLLSFLLIPVQLLLYCGMQVGRLRAAADNTTGRLYDLRTNFGIAAQNKLWFLIWEIFQLFLIVCAIVLFLNVQLLLSLISSWIALPAWLLYLIILPSISFIYVIGSLSASFLDSALAYLLGIEYIVPQKGKYS
jgi:hypothetical protein